MRYDQPDEPYYFDEVIGSFYNYHRPTCHIIERISKRNYKRLRGYKEAQELGLMPCSHCRPAFDPSLVRRIPEPEPPEGESEIEEPIHITATGLADRRRGLLRLLDQIDQDHSGREGVATRIGRLTHQNRIPREVSACMRVITEMRNVAEYQAKTLSSNETAVVEAAWQVIGDWAMDSGLSVPAEPEK